MSFVHFAALRLGYYNSSTDSDPIVSSVADTRFIEAYFKSLATSGDNRGLYLRMDFAAVGGGDGARIYALAKAAIATMQGLHATAQIATGGSITGLIDGVRATLATSSGLTLSGGSAYALRVDSDLGSAVTGMTKAAFFGVSDVNGTNKMPLFMDLSGMEATTDGSTMYWYNASGETFACKGGLKISTPDGELYIPIGTVT